MKREGGSGQVFVGLQHALDESDQPVVLGNVGEAREVLNLYLIAVIYTKLFSPYLE